MNIPFFRPSYGEEELINLRRALAVGHLTSGHFVEEFERRFADRVGAKYAIAVNSCTAALHLAADALRVRCGDRVFVPSMTFTASAEILHYLGAEPIFLDVDDRALVTPEILLRAAEEHPDVKCAIFVHFAGHACQMFSDGADPGILEICRQRGIAVIEDAAHAFPCVCQGQTVGAIGDATCFSFYANKTIACGEGGMLTTDSASIADTVRLRRKHGMQYEMSRGLHNTWKYDVVDRGFKYNMPEMSAAIGLAQLEKADKFHQARLRLARCYDSRLRDCYDLLIPPLKCAWEDHSWHLFCVELRSGKESERDALIEFLCENGVQASVHYRPLHMMTSYAYQAGLERSERRWRSVLSLPLFPGMREDECDAVCQLVRCYFDKGKGK